MRLAPIIALARWYERHQAYPTRRRNIEAAIFNLKWTP